MMVYVVVTVDDDHNISAIRSIHSSHAAAVAWMENDMKGWALNMPPVYEIHEHEIVS